MRVATVSSKEWVAWNESPLGRFNEVRMVLGDSSDGEPNELQSNATDLYRFLT